MMRSSGAIRGVYPQGNEAVRPVFNTWIEPLRSLGMTMLTIRGTGGTDHQSFDRVGLPLTQLLRSSSTATSAHVVAHTGDASGILA